MNNFKAKLLERGYPGNLIENTPSEVIFEDRGRVLLPKEKRKQTNFAFLTQYQPSVPNTKQTILDKWHFK